MAGGMPLAFTQEDFLVFSVCLSFLRRGISASPITGPVQSPVPGPARTGQGYPQDRGLTPQTGSTYPLHPRQDGGYPSPRTGEQVMLRRGRCGSFSRTFLFFVMLVQNPPLQVWYFKALLVFSSKCYPRFTGRLYIAFILIYFSWLKTVLNWQCQC